MTTCPEKYIELNDRRRKIYSEQNDSYDVSKNASAKTNLVIKNWTKSNRIKQKCRTKYKSKKIKHKNN